MEQFLKIVTKTTGFSSPAVDYVEERLDIPGIKLRDPYFTFFFRVGVKINFPTLKCGDLLIVSRAEVPTEGDICLGVNQEKEFSLYRKGNGVPNDHWGVVIKVMRNGQNNRISRL